MFYKTFFFWNCVTINFIHTTLACNNNGDKRNNENGEKRAQKDKAITPRKY